MGSLREPRALGVVISHCELQGRSVGVNFYSTQKNRHGAHSLIDIVK